MVIRMRVIKAEHQALDAVIDFECVMRDRFLDGY
jgi:hypothetical protein